MIRNYFLIAFRNLHAHKGYSLISIGGLAISMSVCLMIITFVKQEWSHDTFHADAGRIYHLYSDFKAGINPTSDLYGTTPVTLGEVLKQEHPEVETSVTLKYLRGRAIRENGKFSVAGFYATSNFFDMLGFEIVQGNRETPLDDPASIVLSQATATRLFGDVDPIGQPLQIEGKGDFTVTGVVARPPENTVFEFDVLASFQTLVAGGFDPKTVSWHRTVRSHFTFAKVREGVDADLLWSKLPIVVKGHYPAIDDETRLTRLVSQPLISISSGPRMGNMLGRLIPKFALYGFMLVASVILATGCFNYVGFSVACGLRRAREVGVRKVVGAGKRQIVAQFQVEAFCVSFAALALAALSLKSLTVGFMAKMNNGATEAQIHAMLTSPSLWVIFIAFAAAVGLIAGLYPALYLSRFLPTTVLKGNSSLSERGFKLRKTLIVVQCTLSLFFIITTVISYAQTRHILETQIGFNEKNLLNIETRGADYTTLRGELLRHPGVVGVSGLSILTGTGGRNDVWLESESQRERVKGYYISVDEYTIDNLEIPLLAGRVFSGSDGDRSEQTILLNEVALKKLRLGSPAEAVGKTLKVGEREDVTVIGVVKDYRFYSRIRRIDPLVLRFRPDKIRFANLRFDARDYDVVVTHVEKTWERLVPGEQLKIGLYEHQLANSNETWFLREVLHMIGLASAFLVSIACLGLLGMTGYAMQARRKEVGVRKVCGASTPSLVGRLSRSYLILMGIASAIAVPLAAFTSNLWLQEFDNRIELGPAPFLISVLVLAVMGLLTVGSQTLFAARANPTDVLRHE